MSHDGRYRAADLIVPLNAALRASPSALRVSARLAVAAEGRAGKAPGTRARKAWKRRRSGRKG